VNEEEKMVGVNNILCSCGRQMVFQPIRGSFFCPSCGKLYWIDGDEEIEDDDTEIDFPPEGI
jgi:hypothetical protein